MGEGLKRILKRHGGLTVKAGGKTKHYTVKDLEEFSFKEMEAVSKDGQFKAVWEWIGEGWRNGDFNPSDPKDFPLLRFSCYIKNGDDWDQIDDASYCTAMDARTPRPILRKALKNGILREIVSSFPYHKKDMEWMSHICAEEVEKWSEHQDHP